MGSLSAPRDNGPVMMSRLVMLALICAGVAGNYLRYDIFFNIQFIFGSIFGMLALQLFGFRRGVLCSLVISSVTWHIWNHPYAIVIMSAEALVVGLLVQRKKTGLVLADALYWLVLGMPLVVLFYYGVMHLPLYAAITTMLKQATNGVANTLLARLLFFAASPRFKGEPLSLREIVFDLLVLFSLLPALLLTGRASSIELSDIEASSRRALLLSSQRVEREITMWLEHHIMAVEHIAWMAARMPVPLVQKSIEQTLAGDKDFLRMGLLDASATSTAYSPLFDELGQKNIGRNFKDRPFIPVLKKTLKPMLSEVVMARMGTPKPMVAALAPVVVRGRYAGYVTGILDLDRLDSLISLVSEGAPLLGREYALLGRNGNVIASSRKSTKGMQPAVREPGEVTALDKTVYQWTPSSVKNVSLSDRWKKAVYFTEAPIAGLSGWSLILEQPLAPYQRLLYERYSVSLVWIFGVLLVALVIAHIISRKMTVALEMLGAHSAGLPEKLVRGESLTLPTSDIRETQQLIRNIDEMSGELSRKFTEVNALNATLEERIVERTRELHLSKERFRSLIESSSDWIWEIDASARYTYSSPQVRDVLGYEPHELVGRTPFDFMSAEEASRVSTEFGALVAGRQRIVRMENINLRKDGRRVVLETSGVPIVDGEGRLTGYRGIDRDITERRQAEEEVRRLANEQKIILSTIAVGIVFVRNRKILWANPAFEKIYGFGAGEFLGSDTRSLYADPADYERTGREGYPLIETGSTYSIEVAAVRKDGGRIWISLVGRAVNPVNPEEGSIWMFQDITTRKATEEALRENERLFRESIEFMPVPIGIANPDGTVRAYNKSFVETYGYTIKDIPTIEGWIQTAYPDAEYQEQARQAWNADVEKAIREGGSTPIREYEVTCKNGRVKSVEITMRPIGSLFIATFYDVTARKNIEKDLIEKRMQLEDLTRNLEQRVQEEIALRSRNEQMLVQQSKLAAMGEMLGAIAHQWRQPLNALGLIIQNLGETHTYGELDTAYVEKSVRQSMAHVQHMSKTIDDFRNFFQPDKERTTFDAMQAVSEVLDLFSAQLESNNIIYRLACHTHGTFFDMHTPVISCAEKMVEGYRNEFEHVILNLVNNSRDAILARRAASGAAVQGAISFDFSNRNGKVILSVSDNGGGIDSGVIDRIFEPYFTTKQQAGGTGLGLYMAKVIIEKHLQGTLSVENRGEGAVFTIELQQTGTRPRQGQVPPDRG